jgi:hypothetical protein
MSFIPSISLPSNAFSFAFKRQFGPSDKLRLEVLPLSLHTSLHLLKIFLSVAHDSLVISLIIDIYASCLVLFTVLSSHARCAVLCLDAKSILLVP